MIQRKVSQFAGAFDKPWMWFLLSALMLGFNCIMGPRIHFPIAFVLPVSLAAWHRGQKWAIPFALLMPLARFAILMCWELPKPGEELVNAIILTALLVVFSFLVEIVARQNRQLEREVKILEGILPICSYCKRIRNDKGQWIHMETYISSRTDAHFSHGLCHQCVEERFPEYAQSR